MKIVVTAQGNNLDAPIDPRFGRCKYFIVVDSETLEFTAKENPFINASGGAGVQAGQLVLAEKPELIITGRLGPKATSVLAGANVQFVDNPDNKTVKEAVEEFSKK